METALLGPTAKLVTFALDIASVRQQVLAHNIANANTPGFVPYEVHFDRQLAQLRDKLHSGDALKESDIPRFTPQLTLTTLGNGLPSKVALDMEAAKLSENVLHYQAIAKAYSHMSNLLSIAINEGKR